jgi:hypothetical protein
VVARSLVSSALRQEAAITEPSATIAKFMEFEQRYLGTLSPPVPSSRLVALADLFMHRLNEVGPMSREELVDLAVKEWFFPDTEAAVHAAHPNS